MRQFFTSGGELRVFVLEEYIPKDAFAAIWHFDAGLQFSRVVLADDFRGRHHELELTGAIRHHFTDDRSEFGDLTWLTKP